MMKVSGRGGPAEEPGQAELAPGRAQEVLPADHQRDLLLEIVHRHTVLVGPLAVAVAEHEVAGLERRVLLLLLPEAEIVEPLEPRLDPDPERPPRSGGEPFGPAGAGVAQGLPLGRLPRLCSDGPAGALAPKGVSGAAEPLCRSFIPLGVVTLS